MTFTMAEPCARGLMHLSRVWTYDSDRATLFLTYFEIQFFRMCEEINGKRAEDEEERVKEDGWERNKKRKRSML